jgi:hypothetical protein
MTAAVGAQASRGDDGVAVTVTNRRGRSIGVRALPAADQNRVERLRAWASQLRRQQIEQVRLVRIRIRCTWPPLSCEIIINASF